LEGPGGGASLSLSLSLRELCKGYLERGSFSEDPEGYGEEGSEDGHHSPWGPRWGICRGLVCRVLEKTLETGTFLHRGSVKNHGGGSVYREL